MRIVLIKGPQGCGKTTRAEAMQKEQEALGKRVALLEDGFTPASAGPPPWRGGDWTSWLKACTKGSCEKPDVVILTTNASEECLASFVQSVSPEVISL